MRKIHPLFAGTLLLLQFCSPADTKSSAGNAMDGKDSIRIATAFVPPFNNADSIYTSFKTSVGKSEVMLDFLNLNYAKALVMTGKLDKADTLISTATSRAGFDTTSLANARYANLKAAIEGYQQNQQGAIGYYKKAIEVFEKHKDFKSAAAVNFNIANIFLSRINYPMAYQYSVEAVRGFGAANDTLYYASALAVNAVSAIMLGKKDEAKAAAKQAEEVSERYKNPLGLAMSNYALAEIALHDKQYEAAISRFRKAIPLALQLQQVTVAAAAYTSLTKAYLENENYDLAIAEGKIAIDYAKKYGYKDVLYALHRRVSQAYQHAGNESLSLQHLKEADGYFREEFVANDAHILNGLLVQYQTERKEKQIAEQELKIQKQQSGLLYAVLGGALSVSVLGGIFLYNRKTQKLKLHQLQQEKENAILNSFILGEERERNRISHELHDGVAAMIGAAKMSLEAIPHLRQEKRMEQLSKVRGILEHSHSDIRHIAHNLLPTVLEKEGLIEATVQFVSGINETKLVSITVRNENSNADELSRQLQLMLFRVIQELVNNIIKHSQAKNAELVFSKSKNGLLIEITDDGIGYDDTTHKENQGLYSITQRLKSIGGNFKISRSSYGGTQAKVELMV